MNSSVIKFSFSFTMFLFSVNISAQTIDRDVYSNAGRSATNSGIELSYNIGEAVVFTGTGTSAILTQGFEQEDLATITFINSYNSVVSANAFPNPVEERLYVDVSSSKAISDFELEVYDIQGRKVNIECLYPSSFFNYNFILDFSFFNSGVYIVKLSSSKSNYSSVFKISKR